MGSEMCIRDSLSLARWLLDVAMAQKSQGIQTLLEAEKEAAAIVDKARAYRAQRVKDAQGEAEKEIDEIKQAHERELAEFTKKVCGDGRARWRRGCSPRSTRARRAAPRTRWSATRARSSARWSVPLARSRRRSSSACWTVSRR